MNGVLPVMTRRKYIHVGSWPASMLAAVITGNTPFISGSNPFESRNEQYS